jgi:hypothetical protein
MLLLLYGPRSWFWIGCWEGSLRMLLFCGFECASVGYLRSLADHDDNSKFAKDAMSGLIKETRSSRLGPMASG